MKQSVFITVVLVVAYIISLVIFFFVFGNPANFKGGDTGGTPINIFGQIYKGGLVVTALMTISIMVVTFVIERLLSLAKAKGRGAIEPFVKKVQSLVQEGDIDGAIAECNKQKGSMANVLRLALERYNVVKNDPIDAEKKLAEVQRAIEEAMMLEVPLLERNLVALSTIASISVLVGLFGTVLGMIRAFQALATAGTPNATELSTGISEALVNTAFGIFGAIVAIIGYNYFMTRVSNFTYMIDEATYNIMQILTVKSK
ncbi:MAG: MotA/TolQ/ExbB proton channel family protein [Ignavibacteria bacterium]|nr:MotA/TolQ/ExbB proton channel family protein [Ignavibacteria bacterium]